jgi:signal peptidase II
MADFIVDLFANWIATIYNITSNYRNFISSEIMSPRLRNGNHLVIAWLSSIFVYMSRIARNTLVLLVLVLNIGCDQVSKEIIRHQLEYHEPVEVLGKFFTLIKIENTGAFLSWGETFSGPLRWIFMIAVPILVLALGLWYLFRKANLSNALTAGLCLIIGGGIGNIVDRVLYGSVTDFMLMDFGIFRTGIFNIADVSIMAGLILILYDALKSARTTTVES